MHSGTIHLSAILKIADKYIVGYNPWRKQWEFPAGGIEEGETSREAAIRELYEETHQKNEMLDFKGLFKVQDARGNIIYTALHKILYFEILYCR